jgi:hypothetical protein
MVKGSFPFPALAELGRGTPAPRFSRVGHPPSNASKGWSFSSLSASAIGHTLFDTPENAASTVTLVTGLIPFLSQASAVYAMGIDIYKTVNAVRQCD